jgi:exopolysaccharide production protein ExoZ
MPVFPGPRCGEKASNVPRSAPLQYLRGMAAVSVVLYHASIYLKMWRKDGEFFKVFDDRIGLFGVTLFFVASGALMGMLARRADPGRFLLHRIVRIYPTYLLIATTMLLLAPLLRSGISFDPWAFGLVAGGPHMYALGVEWTLPFEITFYIIVFGSIVIGLGRWMAAVGVAWVAAIILVQRYSPSLQTDWQFPTITHIPLASRTISFAAGLIVPFLAGAPLISVLLGIICLLVGFQDYARQIWWCTAGCACLVAASLSDQAIQTRPISALNKLGDWSFALYLCHVTVIQGFFRSAPAGSPTRILWAAAIVTALIVGSLFGEIDLQLYYGMRTWADKISPTLRVTLVAGFLTAYLSAGVVWIMLVK